MNNHEGNLPTPPGGNAEGSLKSAASLLGGTASADGRTPAGQRRVLQGRQERDLEAWAKESVCWLNAPDALAGFIRGGEEHRVRPGEDIFAKATYAGQYGFTVIAATGGPTMTHALPCEYLERLLLANRLFEDDIRLLGVTRETDGLVIVTSQPTVVGVTTTREEMTGYFTERHFTLIPNFFAGYRGSLSFYRDLDQMAVFDAHPANFLKDRRGIILPIDAVLVQAGDELAAMLEDLCAR